MADVTKITLPNGTTKDIKDATARADNDDNFNRSGYKNLSTVYTGTGAAGSFIVPDTLITLPAGDYVVTFKSTATSSTGSINFKDSSSIVQTVTFSNSSVVTKEITITSSTITKFNIYSNAATTYSDIMICTKSDYTKSNTFVKHALSNTTITPELIELVDSGAKNLYNPSNTSTSASGLTGTITRNSDGSYTISGTTSGTVYYNMGSWIAPEDGYYILSGGSSAESASQLIYDDHNWQTYESGEKKKLAYWTKGSTHKLYIRLGSGITLSNVTFYPMICTKAAWDVSQKYVPYRPTYEETVEQVAENKNNISIEDITNKISMETGFTIDTSYSKLYKQGKHIFGNLILKKSTGVYNSTGDPVATITDYPPVSTVINAIGLTNTVNQMQNIGWVYISSASETPTGSISIRDSVGSINNCAVIQVDYVTA